MKKKSLFVGATLTFSALALAAVIAAGAYTLFGDSSLASPGFNSPHAAKVECDSAPGYGGVDFDVPAGLTLNDLNTLSADWLMQNSTNGGGSPRFQVNVETNDGTKNLFIYLGQAPAYAGTTPNVWQNTGNLAAAGTVVDASQLGGGFYDTYGNVQATYGELEISGIQVVTDGCWLVPNQSALVDNVNINGSVVNFDQPLNANECKNNGWRLLNRADGTTFRNQGDCVQYANTGK